MQLFFSSSLLSNRRYDDDPDKIWNCGAWFEYILVVVVSALLLLAATVLTVFWAIYYRQGFDLKDADRQFNLHPVLMVVGYITLSGLCKYFIEIIFFKYFMKQKTNQYKNIHGDGEQSFSMKQGPMFFTQFKNIQMQFVIPT